MDNKPRAKWRQDLGTVIFGVDTFYGRLFDIVLLVAILLSVLAVMLESVDSVRENYGISLQIAEWVFTILFTLEYTARIVVARKPVRYTLSFFGIIDLLAIIPTYLSLIFSGAQMLAVIRIIRLMRIFRILKLVRFLGEASQLMSALKSSRAKITVFIGGVLIMVCVLGSLMYLIEGRENGFTSIPRGIYWAIVTLTTVGYGDIAPQTVLGQFIASGIMILGYGIIAVPTGIVTSEMTRERHKSKLEGIECPGCGNRDHDKNALYCKLCGTSVDKINHTV